ncbi:MAG: LuxR C-terminal-related transcriptional regulator [Muribaculum sp.]|nr:LuxR C-terminal-related transcriptional regulator [Muribaculum sp.]
MIQNQSSYSRHDSLRDIITDNNDILMVLSRFDISLGFGDNSVEQTCRDNNVDIDTFLAVINIISGKRWEAYKISLPSLIGYLRKSHEHFIDYSLPLIKKMLIEGIHQTTPSEISIHIMNFFDNYVAEVRKHMEYENNVIFKHVENLIGGNLEDRLKVSEFSHSHEHTAGKLDDLKELFVYQYNQQNNEMINNALYQIIRCGKDLVEHCNIENKLLFPNITLLEQNLISSKKDEEGIRESNPPAVDTLSSREREIVKLVAKGFSNKEIADKLCLSFHTVTTHRRNISEKLNIHSTAALAIFALVHKIIDISDVNMADE